MGSLRKKMEATYAAVAFAERNQPGEAVLLLKGAEDQPEARKSAEAVKAEARKSRPVQRAE